MSPSNVYRLPLPPMRVWRVKHVDPSGTRRVLLVPARSNAEAMDHVEGLLGPSMCGSCIHTLIDINTHQRTWGGNRV